MITFAGAPQNPSLEPFKGFKHPPGVKALDELVPDIQRLAQEALRAEGQLMRLALTSRDCAALMPGGGLDTNERVKALEAELARLDTDMAETEAQHRLYTLLQERTRQAALLTSHAHADQPHTTL
jgi:hypothetical protein